MPVVDGSGYTTGGPEQVAGTTRSESFDWEIFVHRGRYQGPRRPAGHVHTRTDYRAGCRCPTCRAAQAAYMKEYLRQRRQRLDSS